MTKTQPIQKRDSFEAPAPIGPSLAPNSVTAQKVIAQVTDLTDKCKSADPDYPDYTVITKDNPELDSLVQGWNLIGVEDKSCPSCGNQLESSDKGKTYKCSYCPQEPIPFQELKKLKDQLPPHQWQHGYSDSNMNDERREIAARMAKGEATWEDLARIYKFSPHAPPSLLMKYIAHRVTHLADYEDHQKGLALDDDFIKHHTAGSDKSAHVAPWDLHRWLLKNGSGLVQGLLDERDRVHHIIRKGIGLNVRDINGEPYVALTRGLNSDLMNRERALSSWADIPDTGFGNVQHHAWVPLKDVWISFDLAPEYTYSGMGRENEFLVSHTGPRYESEASNTKTGRFKRDSDFRSIVGNLKPTVPDTERYALQNEERNLLYDDATDEQTSQFLAKALPLLEYPDGYSLQHAINVYRGVGPKSAELLRNMPGRDFGWDHPLITPREHLLPLIEQYEKQRSPVAVERWIGNPALTGEDLDRVIDADPDNAARSIARLLDHPNLNSNHLEKLASKTPDMRLQSILHNYDLRKKLSEHPLLSNDARTILFDRSIKDNGSSYQAGTFACSPEHLDRLFTIDHHAGIEGLMKYPGLIPTEVLEKAYNKYTPSHLIGNLLNRKGPVNEEFLFQKLQDGIQGKEVAKGIANHYKAPISDDLQLATARKFVELIQNQSSLVRKGVETRDSYADAAVAWEGLRRLLDRKHIAAPVVDYLLHTMANLKVNGTLEDQTGSIDVLSKLERKAHVFPNALEAAWPKDIPFPSHSVDVNGIVSYDDPNHQVLVDPVLKEVAGIIARRKAYAARKEKEHVIKPWPQGLAKNEFYPIILQDWLEKVKQNKLGREGYHYVTDPQTAYSILENKVIPVQPHPVILDGHVVAGHFASSSPITRAKRLKPGKVIVHFSTDLPHKLDAHKKPYWTEDVPVKEAQILQEPMQKAIGDIRPPVQNKENPYLFDYSHLVAPELAQDYQIRLGGHSGGIVATLLHHGSKVGELSGYRTGPNIEIGKADIVPPHSGKGLGINLYEALMAHAKNHLGVTHVQGGKHSSMAHSVHQKLALRHGLGYSATENFPSPEYATQDEWEESPNEPFDNKWLGYRYAIKSELAKNHPPIKFPGLGVPDDRRSVRVVDSQRQDRIGALAFGAGQARHRATIVPMTPAEKVQHGQDYAAKIAGSSYGLTSRVNPDLSQALSEGERHQLAVSYGMPADPVTPDQRGPISTELHERQHAILGRVAQKLGPDFQQNQEDREELAYNLIHSIPVDQRWPVISYGMFRRGGPDRHEEYLASLLNFLNNPAERDHFFNSPEWQNHDHNDGTPEARRAFETNMKRAHKNLSAAAEVATRKWAEPGVPWRKSEESSELNLLTTNPVEDWEVNVANMMLGHHPDEHKALLAAKWLSGKEVDPDDNVYRMALRLYDGDFHRAALHAYGLTDSEKNVKALKALAAVKHFGKSEDEVPEIHSVEPAMPEAKHTAEEVERAVESRSLRVLHLNGKHSKGAMAAKDPRSGYVWLLKPGSGKDSPAAGVKDSKASQSRREAAFWHLADQMGLGGFFPHCDLLMINAQEWAAMRLLGPQFQTIDAMNREVPGAAIGILDPYRARGVLHRWAAAEFILGNTDSHGQNLLVDKETKSVALIDHGSAFSGKNFSPWSDPKSFIPYYLRAWGPKGFFKLSPEERLRFMPEVNHEVDAQLRAWVQAIKPERLASVTVQYGIDPKEILERLAWLKSRPDLPMCQVINKLWAGGPDFLNDQLR